MLPTGFHSTPLPSFSVVLTLTEAVQYDHVTCIMLMIANILQSIPFHTGSRYWTVKGSRVKGRRKKITSFGFPPSVDHIDAAVYINETGHTLFFTQDQYWRYFIAWIWNTRVTHNLMCTIFMMRFYFFRYNENQKALEESNPRFILDDFPGIKSPVSAALYRHGGWSAQVCVLFYLKQFSVLYS